MATPSITSPISKLPSDILWMIFESALSEDLIWEYSDWKYPEDIQRVVRNAVSFGLVSKTWQEVILHMTRWGRFLDTDAVTTGNDDMWLWNLMVERAKPSKIWLRHVDMEPHPDTSVKQIALYRFRQMFLPTLMNAAPQSISRIELNFWHPEYFQGLTSNAVRARMVDVLLNATHATFGNTYWGPLTHEVRENYTASAHTLRQLLSFGTPLPSPSCLRVLHLRGILHDFNDIHMLLQATPLLEELRLESDHDALQLDVTTPPPDNTRHAMVHLPRLRMLKISQLFPVALLLVPKLSLPSITEVSVVVDGVPPDDPLVPPHPDVKACVAQFCVSMMRLLLIAVDNTVARLPCLNSLKICIEMSSLHHMEVRLSNSNRISGSPFRFWIYTPEAFHIPPWVLESLSSASYIVQDGCPGIHKAMVDLPKDNIIIFPVFLTFIGLLCSQITNLSIDGSFHHSILACRDFLPPVVFPRLKVITWNKGVCQLLGNIAELMIYSVDFEPLIAFAKWHHEMKMPLVVNRFDFYGLDPEFTLDTVEILKAHTGGRFVERLQTRTPTIPWIPDILPWALT